MDGVKNVSFGAAVQEYRRHARAHNRSYVTYTDPALKVWEAAFPPETPLSDMSTRQIEQIKLDRAERVSRSTVDTYVAVLKAFFNWCLTHGYATTNPVKPVKLFRPSNEVVRYLMPAEFTSLVQAARGVEKSPYLPEKIQLGLATGLRRGNLFNLRWEQVDWLARVVRVQRTKGGKPHEVPLNDTAMAALGQLYAADTDSPYVFPHLTGKHAGQAVQDVKDGFGRALKAAAITHFRWHDLRHTAASWMVMGGASLKAVQEFLGHKSLKMTLRYAHLAPGYLAKEVSILDQFASGERESFGKPPGAGEDGSPQLIEKNGSSGWTRTSNPPVNSLMQV